MWDSLMKRSIAAGINLIETYVFWNLHEPVKGQYYFDDYADLVQFLNVVKENQLFVNLRIGPYVCAEWNYGGFPEWLREIPGIKFRDYNEPFMSEMQTWMTYIVNMLREQKMFAPQGGPIILAQVENEYGWLEQEYGASGRQYALWAASMAQNLSIGVPWIMCSQGDISTVINTCNGFYCEDFVPGHVKTFPNQPLMWTENWPGWMQDWGQARPHRPTQDVAYASARWFAKGGTHMNYYMWHGGSNFDRWTGGPYIVTSYDYDVALDEYGYPSEPKYSHSAALHSVLIKYSETLLQNDIPTTISLGTDLQADVYGTGSSQLAFLSNISPSNNATVTFQNQSYFLAAWSVSLVGGGKLLYNTNVLPSYSTPSFSDNPKKEAVQANFAGYWSEPVGVWGTGETYNYPPMQLDVTHDYSDYLWYTTTINITTSRTLKITSVQNRVLVFLNEQFVGNYSGGAITVQLPDTATGKASLALLTATVGLVNYGAYMEAYVVGILGEVYLGNENITAGPWTVQPGLQGESLQVYSQSGGSKVKWNSQISEAVGKPLVWFTGTFAMPPNPNDTTGFALDMIGMGKGMAFVNGHMIGRYWMIEGVGNCTCVWAGGYNDNLCRTNCGLPSQRYYHVPEDWLTAENNLVVLFEEDGGNPSNVSLIVRTTAAVSISHMNLV
eukprot:Phypoly_transcript_03433.p1 GENE.Phypoly_transcript_03433~~Phypoly_transcript_03433.p1  ORF type:complete len:668 (+),score=82.90 Phypoly_transcript_03433:402-2405(+)